MSQGEEKRESNILSNSTCTSDKNADSVGREEVITDVYFDQQLNCKACRMDWVFTADEQKFYNDKGLLNTPRSCKSCRGIRKREYRKNKESRRNDGGQLASPTSAPAHTGHFGWIEDGGWGFSGDGVHSFDIRSLRDCVEAQELYTMKLRRAWTCCWCEDKHSRHCCLIKNKRNETRSRDIGMTPCQYWESYGAGLWSENGVLENIHGWRCQCKKESNDAESEEDISDAIKGVRVYNFYTGEYGDPL